MHTENLCKSKIETKLPATGKSVLASRRFCGKDSAFPQASVRGVVHVQTMHD